MISRFLRNGLALVVVLSFLGGCAGKGTSTALLPDPAVRFVNLSPDSSLDFWINDQRFASNIGLAGSSANFQSIEPDEYDCVLTETGSSIELANDFRSFSRDTDTLWIAFGLKNFGTENEKRLEHAFIPFDRRTPNATKARVIAFHSWVRKTGEGNHSIVFKNDLNVPSVSFEAIEFGGASIQEIDAGPITFYAQRDGTDNEILRVDRTLEAGKIYLMTLSGIEDTVGATAPQIRFIELSSR